MTNLNTKIEWTDCTWSPTVGCTKVVAERVRRGQKMEENPNWAGGRTVTPAGYILVKRPEHPAADTRGYVYEHRLVMERHLGRQLTKGERVRHKDSDPANNNPRNLRLTVPPDPTEQAQCACGCGVSFARWDSSGRPRRFVTGHNASRGVREGARPKAETGAGLDKDGKLDLVDAFGGRCAYGCGAPATCWDHLIPWAAGGSFTRPGNAVPACRTCNQRKGACSDEAVWDWIVRGVRGHGTGPAWESVLSLAIGWGDLDFGSDNVLDGHTWDEFPTNQAAPSL